MSVFRERENRKKKEESVERVNEVMSYNGLRSN